ncbi:hypothetical protein AgCh_018259 [Apium graveolens]
MVVVETQGHSGGIVFLWRHKEETTLKSYNKNHIDLQIVRKNGEEYRMTGVYGEPDRRKRLSQNYKRGGRPYPESLIQGFREVLDDCNLIDMDLHGHQYTWERGVGSAEWIEVRLDRALVTPSFLDEVTGSFKLRIQKCKKKLKAVKGSRDNISVAMRKEEQKILAEVYQIAHTGRLFGSITPARGIRQGDPLSSYLFLLCIEGFSALIHKYEIRGLIQGIKVAQKAPHISHILFADDCYFFCKASIESANQVMTMPQVFEQASGQKVNVDKSSVFFNRNTGSDLKQELCNKLHFNEANENISYLGIPSLITRSKSAVFGYVKEKLQDRVHGWDKKQISKGGKEILIKSVGQTHPNYTMIVFLLPVETCKDLERTMSRYWWKSDGKKEKGIHWFSWDKLWSRKANGGIRFCNVRDFNIALLRKQAWRIIQFPEKLVSQVFKA